MQHENEEGSYRRDIAQKKERKKVKKEKLSGDDRDFWYYYFLGEIGVAFRAERSFLIVVHFFIAVHFFFSLSFRSSLEKELKGMKEREMELKRK